MTPSHGHLKVVDLPVRWVFELYISTCWTLPAVEYGFHATDIESLRIFKGAGVVLLTVQDLNMVLRMGRHARVQYSLAGGTNGMSCG